MPTQDQLVQMLVLGQLGPWAGQGFVPGGITILRPDTMQWETIVADPEDADLMHSELSDPVDPSTTWSAPTAGEQAHIDAFLADAGVHGIATGVGLAPSVGSGFGHAMASAIPASQYTYVDFIRTTLGEIRLTLGTSNGVSGPLSPIKMGRGLQQVDKDGVKWLPVVRMQNERQTGGGGSW